MLIQCEGDCHCEKCCKNCVQLWKNNNISIVYEKCMMITIIYSKVLAMLILHSKSHA